MESLNPDVAKCIMNAGKNVNMDCIIGWHEKGEKHSFSGSVPGGRVMILRAAEEPIPLIHDGSSVF